MPHDAAFLLVSFGGPEGRAEVLPFLRNVTAGRGIPAERLASVAEHYYLFDGISPINAQCRDLLAAIEKNFAAVGVDLPLYWGNRNWHPYLADTMAALASDGVKRVIAFATSAYSSYSSCRQYLEDIDLARAAVGASAPQVVKIRPYYRQDGFISSFASATAQALTKLPAAADLVFTAHSIPESMAAASGPGGAYPAQLDEAARLVAAAVGRDRWRLAYQSRSGPPSVPWLGPDINDCLSELAAAGSCGVCVIPLGFVSDHLEVQYDLDVEAAATARRLGLPMVRAATPGTDPRFVAMISALVKEYAAGPPAGPCCLAACCGAGRRG